MLIEDRMVQEAFDWLGGNCRNAAHAKADRIRAEYNVKQVRSRLFLSATGTVAEREAHAIASTEYEEAVNREAETVGNDEWHRNQRNKCAAIIEAWRTEQSNIRSMAKVG